MLKASYIRTYRNQKGTVVFVYAVNGSKEALETYENIQGENHRTDEKTGKSLWFTTRFIGKTGSLIITDAGKVVADMSEFDQKASIAAQYGGDFGAALAAAAAKELLGGKSEDSEM
jgi:hypothetical protein